MEVEKPKLYYNEHCLKSQFLRVALMELQVDFSAEHVDIYDGEEQFSHSFLTRVNPHGLTPVLEHQGLMIRDFMEAMEYVDKKFGQNTSLLSSRFIDGEKLEHFKRSFLMLNMEHVTTSLAIFHLKGFTEVLRSPFDDEQLFFVRERQRRLERPSKLNRMAMDTYQDDVDVCSALIGRGALESESLQLVQNPVMANAELGYIEKALDEVEAELSVEGRQGPWLCGPMFSFADIFLVVTLMRLHVLGLDNGLWLNEIRPNVSVYQELAFKRKSLLKMGLVKGKGGELRISSEEDNLDEFGGNNVLASSNSNNATDAAWVGLGGLLVLGALYVARKTILRG